MLPWTQPHKRTLLPLIARILHNRDRLGQSLRLLGLGLGGGRVRPGVIGTGVWEADGAEAAVAAKPVSRCSEYVRRPRRRQRILLTEPAVLPSLAFI